MLKEFVRGIKVECLENTALWESYQKKFTSIQTNMAVTANPNK